MESGAGALGTRRIKAERSATDFTERPGAEEKHKIQKFCLEKKRAKAAAEC